MRSGVARRVIFLYFLSAFVPVAILGWLSYQEVRAVVNASAQGQLNQAAGAYSRSVYDHLLGASSILQADAAQIRGAADHMETQPTNFEGIFVRAFHQANGLSSLRWGHAGTVVLPAIADAMVAHLDKGNVLVLPVYATGAPAIWLVTRIDATSPQAGHLYAQLDSTYLWDEPDTLPRQTSVCVLGQGAAVLVCSDAQRTAMAIQSVVQRVDKPVVDDGWLVAHSAMFLKPKFAQAQWTVVAMRPGGLAVEFLARMAQKMLGIVLLTLLMVALLSVSQIRRTLIPLELLVDATRRIAREQFDQPVVIQRKNEFGELADSLNSMAHRLGQSICAAQALSDIDQAILRHTDIAQIIDRVQLRILAIVPGAAISIFIPDELDPTLGTAYLRRPGDVFAQQSRPCVDKQMHSGFQLHPNGFLLDESHWLYQSVADAFGVGTQSYYFLLPVVAADQAVALVVVGVGSSEWLTEWVLMQVRDLGGRVGVALAAHAREAQLLFMARHDGLTGLPNREFLSERMEQELAHTRRDGSRLAVLFIDLDRFKNINDALGHDAGDQLLCQVSQRLKASVRDSDTIARLGGDEFVVLQTGLQSPQHAANMAENILQVLLLPFEIAGVPQFIGGSIGMAVYPGDGNTAQELLKCADIAMYGAKKAGRGCLVFFEESMNQALKARAHLEQELRQAIPRGQLTVHYQPRIRLADGRVSGAEALLRWQHPELGWVSPARFIPLAEESGLIDQIGPWVLRHVCAQMAAWQSAGYAIGTIAVNLSGRQLRANNLLDQVRDALRSTGLAAHSLELEVTESVLIKDVEFVIALLNQLKDLGVSIALDDFGTDYSSMMYLKRLPISILKIDQSFVSDLVNDAGSRSITQAIIALAHALHKTVVAEGVETQAQAQMLREWGCEEVQGYYFSHPIAAVEFEAKLAKQTGH